MGKIFTITHGFENMGALKTGGQGSVYKVRRSGEIITAVKVLPTPIYDEGPGDKNFTTFQNEVQKLKKVNEEPNPHVAKIISSGITETGSLPYIEMEFIEGPDLEDLLKPPYDPVFKIKEVIKVAEQLAHALAHCHKVDVKHGDVKTNNVKFNIHSGNYILLDFGLAIMSDEQRRTSLRQAGAIEFMAPEQNEGLMLFESDVYSFGIILFELLAGVVPFPLTHNSETARNTVRVAHEEISPPDFLLLRKDHLPSAWTEEEKAREMNVPKWLVQTVHKCLEKKPENRFVNGMALYDYIITASARSENKNEWSREQVDRLKQENQQLVSEKLYLQQQLRHLQESGLTQPLPGAKNSKKRVSGYFYLLLLLLGIGTVAFAIMMDRYNKKIATKDNEAPKEIPKRSIGQYKVSASRAYFYDQPQEGARRTAYLIPSNDVVTASNEQNGFIYTEFTNSKAQTSKGWIRKTDLVSLEKWTRNAETDRAKPQLTQGDINLQLKDARNLLENNEIKAALYIYSFLLKDEVPEAMYEYGNLGLQKKNDDIDCQKAFELVEKASDKGYIPAKRTLGFLFVFADNKEVLKINDYDHCSIDRDVFQGSKLMLEAVRAGDTIAKRLVQELNIPLPDSINQ